MIAGDLLFIGAVFLFFAAPFLAIWSVGPHQVIGRARYGLLYFLLLCLSLLLTLTDFIEPNDWERFFRSPVGVISVAVSIFLLTRIAAMRANDAGLHIATHSLCLSSARPLVLPSCSCRQKPKRRMLTIWNYQGRLKGLPVR
jgi:hypothetical protein